MVATTTLDLRATARQFMPVVVAARSFVPAAIATWHARMLNEYGSSRVFAALARQMIDAGVDSVHCAQVEEFVAEERRHGVLCGAVVEALGGAACGALPDAPPIPRHHDTTPRVAVLRNVLSVCCLSETVAVALIAAERLEMPDGSLRELLTTIWSDEIGHARFGWRYLAAHIHELSAVEHAALVAYIPIAIRHVIAHELDHLPLASQPPPAAAALGLCSGTDARALFFDTLATVIVPQLTELGLNFEYNPDAMAG